MNSNLVNSVAVGFMFTMAMWGVICLSITLIEYFQTWLNARKNINTEVPALKLSVGELNTRLAKLEAELAQMRRAQASPARAQ